MVNPAGGTALHDWIDFGTSNTSILILSAPFIHHGSSLSKTGEAKKLRDPPVSAGASVDVTLTAKLWRFVVGRASTASGLNGTISGASDDPWWSIRISCTDIWMRSGWSIRKKHQRLVDVFYWVYDMLTWQKWREQMITKLARRPHTLVYV